MDGRMGFGFSILADTKRRIGQSRGLFVMYSKQANHAKAGLAFVLAPIFMLSSCGPTCKGCEAQMYAPKSSFNIVMKESGEKAATIRNLKGKGTDVFFAIDVFEEGLLFPANPFRTSGAQTQKPVSVALDGEDIPMLSKRFVALKKGAEMEYRMRFEGIDIAGEPGDWDAIFVAFGDLGNELRWADSVKLDVEWMGEMAA